MSKQIVEVCKCMVGFENCFYCEAGVEGLNVDLSQEQIVFVAKCKSVKTCKAMFCALKLRL